MEPKTRPVSTDKPNVKASTLRSIAISCARDVNRSANATSSVIENAASTSPSTPPATASIRLSVSSCRSSRARVAPSAARTEISRSRRTMRASSRFAIDAQTISSTKPAVPSSTHSVGLKLFVSSSLSGIATAWKPSRG